MLCIVIFSDELVGMYAAAGRVPFIKVGSLIVSEFEPIVAVVSAKVGCCCCCCCYTVIM